MFDDGWIITHYNFILKILGVVSLFVEYKEVLKMLELERGLELFFQRFWSKLSSILFVCVLLMMLEEHLEHFSWCVQWHKNGSIWIKNEEILQKRLVISMCLTMSDVGVFLGCGLPATCCNGLSINASCWSLEGGMCQKP